MPHNAAHDFASAGPRARGVRNCIAWHAPSRRATAGAGRVLVHMTVAGGMGRQHGARPRRVARLRRTKMGRAGAATHMHTRMLHTTRRESWLGRITASFSKGSDLSHPDLRAKARKGVPNLTKLQLSITYNSNG